MKIIYISNSIIPSRFANSVHVMKMCNALSQYSDVELIAIKGDKEANIHKKYGSNGKFNLHLIDKVKNIFGSFSYLFHIFMRVKKYKNSYLYGRHLLALMILWIKNIPTIYEAHSMPSGYRRYLELIFFKGKSFKKLVVISEVLKNDYLKSYPSLRDEDIIVAHDGADIPIKKMIEKQNDNKKMNIGYVGHLYVGRGIEIIIQLAETLSDINFHIIGGMEDDIAYWKSKTQNLNNIFFYGYLSHDLLEKHYINYDVLLAPYQIGINQSDGKSDTSRWMSPMKIFEYMSYEKVIISSDIPVLREVLNDKNSILVESDNIESWINAIEILKDVKIRNYLSKNAYNDFINKYTWSKRAKYILDAIEK